MLTQILLLTGASLALAQSTTTAALPAGSPITIVGGSYNGQQIAGKHVGAAQNYQVALSQRTGSSVVSGGDQFYFNSTSNLFMDTTVVSGQGLPCYVIKQSEISGNAGPLECGAATDASYPMAGSLGNDGTVQITGVQSWWVCSVNATQPYGVIPATVVGGFSSAVPSGPGITNCEAITGLKLGGGGSSSTTSSPVPPPTSSVTSTPAPPPSTTNSGNNWGTSTTMTSAAPVTTTMSMPPSSSWGSQTQPAPSTYTGGAAPAWKDISKVGMVIAGGVAMLL
ncbi:hypothetical protein H2204_005334 [Knufia peltigerae]|uniref:Uncharacterized protein n=1 Tax=Knufia peltigerae TaxID=1002370 RepID=A0AA38Y5Z7_9EURO|nr:hypothetical protein H2204_005334 [Knufia peltigerae]